jgi:hypothetical protein
MSRRPLLVLLVLGATLLVWRGDGVVPLGHEGAGTITAGGALSPGDPMAGTERRASPPSERARTATEPISPDAGNTARPSPPPEARSAGAAVVSGAVPPSGHPGQPMPNTASASAPDFEARRAEARRFLAGLYRDFHGREGEAEVIAMWADLIAAGTLTREQAVEHFLDSAPSLQLAAPLARLYLAAFRRAPDEAGWRHWRSVLDSGRSLDAIGEAFASSEEFATTYGGMDDAHFIDLAYRNTLERPPSAQERAQWESRLASGLGTRGDVLLALSESPEFVRATTHEVSASLLYSGLLGRSADPAGFAAWMQTADREGFTRTAMIAGFLGSTEFQARTRTADFPGR